MWSKRSGVSARGCCQSFCRNCKPDCNLRNNLNSYKSVAINLLENINHFPKGFWWATCSNNVTRLNEGNQTSEEHCMRWLMPRWFVILIHWFQGVREANFWNLFWGENWRNYKRVEQATGLAILAERQSERLFIRCSCKVWYWNISTIRISNLNPSFFKFLKIFWSLVLRIGVSLPDSNLSNFCTLHPILAKKKRHTWRKVNRFQSK